MRGELQELQQLADYTCFREFPHLLQITAAPTGGSEEKSVEFASIPPTVSSAASPIPLPPALTAGPPERYIELFRCVAQRTAALVAEWLRVGYVQGNMNSDNTLLGGRTLDYGPYGWMERYDPHYQPFTSDPVGNFAFVRQPTAMSVNDAVLGELSE